MAVVDDVVPASDDRAGKKPPVVLRYDCATVGGTNRVLISNPHV